MRISIDKMMFIINRHKFILSIDKSFGQAKLSMN